VSPRPGPLALLAVGATSFAVLAACAAGGGSQEEDLVPGGSAQRGQTVILQYGCTSCHAIPGVGSVENGVGPDLDDLANQRYIAGQVPNRPEELIRWLQDPQEIEPGTLMPDMGVSEQDARDIAAYLYDQ
jgi:cytochrome c